MKRGRREGVRGVRREGREEGGCEGVRREGVCGYEKNE